MILNNRNHASDAYRIRLDGKAGAENRRELRRGVQEALQRGERRVILDCTTWPQFDLMLLSALVTCASACEEEGAVLELENVEVDIQSRIEALHLGHHFSVREQS